MLKVKFESDINVFIEGIADCENVDTAAIQETGYAARGTCQRWRYQHKWKTCLWWVGWSCPRGSGAI